MLGSLPMLRRLARALRVKRGWTQEALAERAGLDYKYYQLFEAGRTAAPSLKLVEKLAEVFGVSPWVLLCDEVELVEARAGVTVAELSAKHGPGRPRKDGRTLNSPKTDAGGTAPKTGGKRPARRRRRR
ncbi:MAG: helix-turn-helix domain-containing protein [Opitutaceae bacterium]|nr:helix-turn-helix domain-containing protein [Opitutaceae bacterium]